MCTLRTIQCWVHKLAQNNVCVVLLLLYFFQQLYLLRGFRPSIVVSINWVITVFFGFVVFIVVAFDVVVVCV